MTDDRVRRARRRLPHRYPPGQALFLTWNLHGSLPAALYPPPGAQSAGQAFAWIDRYLDAARHGPAYLRQAQIAQVVEDALVRGGSELEHYVLDAYALMANHVHMLVDPKIDPDLFMKSLKGFTVRTANRMLERIGEPFWQAESYDRWVRDDTERARIRAYIENNPVKAGLVERPEDYRWSSAYRRNAP